MVAALPRLRPLWILPIVLAACALMVLPGGALLGSGAGVSANPLHPELAGVAPIETNLVPLNSPTSASSSLLTGLPSTLTHTPWIESLTHQGPTLRPLTSLPNLQLLKDPPSPSASHIDPFYVSQPAPLGLTDFGLGASTYSYNTSHFLGEVTFNSAPNVTDPASTGVVEPGGAADGYVGSMNEFGVQLNTVATKIAIPGSDNGFFWTQNVVDWNDSGIHFVDDTFNLTSGTVNPFYIASGTIYSGCNNGSAGVSVILYNYGGVFQCVGATIPVHAASYPVTIQLYNNATVNAQNRTQVAYGYRIIESGTGQVYTGVSDTVVFNNPTAPQRAPAQKPGFTVDGFTEAPAGLFRDAEIDLVGDIGGDNSVFRSVNGTVHLEYSNASSGGFRAVPSAYNFGGDTGETSTGIADYWTPNHTLHINQGPAMLYGLWNAIPGSSVPSGDIHLAGSISPSYGFVFVSNTPPVLNPWATGARDNLSWLPTTNGGTFSTYLPPLGAPWTSKYYVQAFAAGFAEKNGTPVTGSTTGYALRLTSAPGVLRAPLYMFSNAQAAGLAKSVTGSSIPPYDFTNLVVNINSTFNHLNDYGYPTFVLFMAVGVTQAITVSNIYQGYDSPTGNYYFYDFGSSASTGIAVPGPAISSSLPYYTSGINVFDGVGAQVYDQVLAGEQYGLQLVLWRDSDTQVASVESELEGSGVWVGDSVDTSVWDVLVESGGTGITDIGSTHTTGSYLWVNGSSPVRSVGVVGLSSSDGTFSWISVTNGAIGIATGEDYGAGSDYDSYYYLPGTVGDSVYVITASNDSWGANFSLSERASVHWVTAINGSTAVLVDDSSAVTVDHTSSWGHSVAVYLNGSSQITISWVYAHDYSIGVYINNSTQVTISHIGAWGHSIAIYLN
jgi:Thermopsin